MTMLELRLAVAVVAVAQLVESRIVIPVVVGSNPIRHPNNSTSYGMFSNVVWRIKPHLENIQRIGFTFLVPRM